jgi:hypothetical protein
MNFIQRNSTNLLILLMLLAGAWLRAASYGDLQLSIANAETYSYVEGSRSPLFSWKIFAGQRLFTTNLIYKAANDADACPITAYSEPALGGNTLRGNQPCFNQIALMQNLLAIIGWCFLAWTTAKFMKSPVVRIIAAASIMLFGFTPQVAEWDSILSPESLSLSMFAITLAIGMELAFRISNSESPFAPRRNTGLLVGFIGIFLLWVFVRDVHLYAIPITLALLGLLFPIKKFRNTKHLAAAFAILLAFFIVGFLSARDSLRATRYPLINSVDAYILPHPARVEFFKNFGMPERDAPDYQEWADKHAAKAYGLFLIRHPRFVITTLWDDREQLSADFIQPYFLAPEIKNRDLLIAIGEILHPETPAMYLLCLFLLLALIYHANKLRSPFSIGWSWLGLWFFGIAAATLFLSYFGDTAGLRRHIMPSVEMFRLFMWVFLMPFLDQSLTRTE